MKIFINNISKYAVLDSVPIRHIVHYTEVPTECKTHYIRLCIARSCREDGVIMERADWLVFRM